MNLNKINSKEKLYLLILYLNYQYYFNLAVIIIYKMNTIGDKIRKIREHKGLSQEVIAFELGISQPTYARLEKKDVRISITRLIEITKILNISVSELIDEKENINMSLLSIEKNKSPIENINNSDKDHIQTLKEEIRFLKKLIEKK